MPSHLVWGPAQPPSPGSLQPRTPPLSAAPPSASPAPSPPWARCPTPPSTQSCRPLLCTWASSSQRSSAVPCVGAQPRWLSSRTLT